MPLLRTQIIANTGDGLAADAVTNTVYHTNADGLFDPSVDYDNHCQQVLDCFTGNAANHATAVQYANLNVTAIVSDMADPQPRIERSRKTFSPPGGPAQTASVGPAQLALCMSFYASRNLPSTRGRLYIGFLPLNLPSRPQPSMRTEWCELGHALFDVGGENVAWVVRSEKNNTTAPITTIWCDDSWDVQRRRKLKPTTRTTLTP